MGRSQKPRIRLTTTGLMVIVAVMAPIISESRPGGRLDDLPQKADMYRTLAKRCADNVGSCQHGVWQHRKLATESPFRECFTPEERAAMLADIRSQADQARRYEALKPQYARAARYPWLYAASPEFPNYQRYKPPRLEERMARAGLNPWSAPVLRAVPGPASGGAK